MDVDIMHRVVSPVLNVVLVVAREHGAIFVTKIDMSVEHTPGDWYVDSCLDANGFFTIRRFDGTEHGNTQEQPIATVFGLKMRRSLLQFRKC